MNIPTTSITHALHRSLWTRRDIGTVAGGEWDLDVVPAESLPKIAACLAHWRDGRTWESTGIIDLMARQARECPGADGLRTHADVIDRYARLDRIYAQVRREGRLRPYGRRNILVHIDRHGRYLFGGGGHHRLGMAIALELESVPVVVGVTHELYREEN